MVVSSHELLRVAWSAVCATLLVSAAVAVWRRMAIAGARKEPVPAPLQDSVAPSGGWESGRQATAIFAGGCFWGVQSVFQRVKGVLHTTAGYTGGAARTADYRSVCSGVTGHAEALEVVFDPAKVSHGTLLRVFFSVVHDPTQLNRQGNDTGTQYRSAIFYTDEEQREVAAAYVKQLDAAHVFSAPIVTQIAPLEHFYPGEEYHQDYAIKNPHNPYIQVCDIPKIAALEQQFPSLFQEYRG